MARYQVAGHQVASCGSWGAGLGSDADTRSRYHTPDCRSPETFNPGVVPQPFLSLPPTPTNGSEGAKRMPPGSLNQGPAIHPPPWDSGVQAHQPGPPRALPGPHPTALRLPEVPALSTPGCIGSYRHLPAGVGLGVINHQLQGLPLVGLDESEEVLRLGQTHRPEPWPQRWNWRHISWTAPTSPHPSGVWGRLGLGFLTSWRSWSEPIT